MAKAPRRPPEPLEEAEDLLLALGVEQQRVIRDRLGASSSPLSDARVRRGVGGGFPARS